MSQSSLSCVQYLCVTSIHPSIHPSSGLRLSVRSVAEQHATPYLFVGASGPRLKPSGHVLTYLAYVMSVRPCLEAHWGWPLPCNSFLHSGGGGGGGEGGCRFGSYHALAYLSGDV
jgi:hypothetical protein